jgi:hypothetical protein
MTRDERLQLYKDILSDIHIAAGDLRGHGMWSKQAKVLLQIVDALKGLATAKRHYTSANGGAGIRRQEEKWNE